MKIILMRHGQTDYNLAGVYMGRRLDASINETGKVQMEQTIPELQSLKPEVIISSPMKRTRESAEIIGNALEIPIEFDDRITEIDIGSLSGKSKAGASSLMNLSLEAAIQQYRMGQYDYSPFGGESAKDILERTERFLKGLKQRKEKCIVIMSHGGLVRSLHRVITGNVSLVDKGIANAALIVLEYV